MSDSEPEPSEALPDDPPAGTALDDNVVAFDTADGETVIYDGREPTAWICSSAAVALAESR